MVTCRRTGAANFLLVSDDEIITKPLNTSFLHGMTRASTLTLARDLGYTVNERDFTVDELLEWVKTYEATLSGTAATLTPVGTLVYRDKEITVRDGEAGPNTERLRDALQAIQYGKAPDAARLADSCLKKSGTVTNCPRRPMCYQEIGNCPGFYRC